MNRQLDLPGYVDLEQVGSGGYGRVFRARQPAFDRTVAIKLLYGGLDDAATRRRFERECRALGAVSSHPNIVPVHDAGQTHDGAPYLVMGFVQGGSLADLLARSGPRSFAEVTVIGVKLAGALHTAHLAGVLHRDIKPENVLLSEYGEPQLADFGIAQRTASDTAPATATLAAMTPSHTPPERFAGGPASAVTDVYALASTLFTLLAGRSPFQGSADESVYAVISRAMVDPVPDLRSLGVPDALARVIEHGLSKDPAARPQSALELGRHLQRAQSALGLAVTPLPLPRQESAAVGEPPPGEVAPGALTPAGPEDATVPVPSVPPASTPSLPAPSPGEPLPGEPLPAGRRAAGAARSWRPRPSVRWAAAATLLLVITAGVVVGLRLTSEQPGQPGSPSADASASAGTSAPATEPTSSADDRLVGSLLQPGSPSGVAAVTWAPLERTTAARLANVVPVSCVNLGMDIRPSARASLRLERPPADTALVQVVYRGAPDSTRKAMADLRAEAGCRLSDQTITLVTPASTPGLATAAADLGTDAVALKVESPGQTFFELFFRRDEIVCGVIWSGPYGAERNWSIALATARAADRRLPPL